MRIPDEIEDLVLAFMDQEKKKELRWMEREDIDALLMSEISCILNSGFVEANALEGFPYRVTDRGREILKILSPCKRSGR